ncbi:MAG: bi-domain-containing oxidoreductase [Bacteroidota bacterium]|nr:Gfo/Idh/MocA family oxidoreductase [Flavisolibacter sp.]MDQ3051127.1 bi-domain-containing oxidoreductase [Bacteroidota bacterium]
MEQLIQSLKDGKMTLLEVPFPALQSGSVLVRNHYSVISAGTEGKTVKDARLGYIGKARARQDEVKKVIRSAKTTGIMNTYRMVMNKLDAPSPLGYCCAGEILEVAPDVTEFKKGDLVACGGNGANHAEVVCIQKNLCVKLPANVNTAHAAFATLGAIAMQGIRQADLRLGENCLVIGLGLIGQMTLQMLAASGVKAIGVDVDAIQVERAIKNGSLHSFLRNSEGLLPAVETLTNGHGVDAVIITAGTSSTDPVDFAGEVCRQKGKVVIVGAVPTGFKRTNYFRKELELKMSCSYGPGRYDTDYEDKGYDYPYGYVRWTENRNMEAFVELISSGKINMAPLITHQFAFADALKAYDLIMQKEESYSGIVLKYDVQRPVKSRVDLTESSGRNLVNGQQPVAGFIGAGSFAQNVLLPAVKKQARMKGVATARPANARNIADKYGFEFCTGDANEVLTDTDINTLFIATRHDSHAKYVMEGLKHGKNVFVEKPLCLSAEELDLIRDLYIESGKNLMVGFNRRFSPLSKTLHAAIRQMGPVPVSINYRINAGTLPANHWIHDPQTGGGRIIGEVCHFIDLAMYLSGSPVVSVSAMNMHDANHLNDTVAINLSFSNGSIANISYFSNGNKELSKENLEVFFGGQVAVLDDFNKLTILGKKKSEQKISGQDKGHQQEVTEFLKAIVEGKKAPITFEEQYNSMLATFKVLESIAENGARIRL